MHWSSTLAVIVVTAIITASATTILGYVIPSFGKFMRHLPQYMCKAMQRLKEWYYWKHYHPRYTFINTSWALIKEFPSDGFDKDPTYKIELGIRLQIYNNDDVNSLFLDCEQGKMRLRMYSKGEKRAKYILFNSGSHNPYKVVSNKEKVFDFILTTNEIDIKPRLGDIAHCDKINIGVAQLSRIYHKVRAEPFDVKVDWSNVKLSEVKNA